MARRTVFSLNTTHFDFRRSRVRSSRDGKTYRIEDKFGLSYILEHIDYYKYMFSYDIHNYAELKEMLLKELKEAKYPNIVIITNEED